MKSKGLAKGWVNNAWEHSPEVLLEQGIAKSGAEGILMNICAKTNISNSIEV